MSMSDNDSDDNETDETKIKKDGYCHFNENGHSKTFDINLFGFDLLIDQNPASKTLGHGAVVWDAAVIFSKYLEHDPKQFSSDILHNKRVIELGSGCGLSGIALMLKGSKVTLTDMAKVTDSLTTENAQRIYSKMNSLGKGSVQTPIYQPIILPLDWTDFESFEVMGGNQYSTYDIIVLTDCIFSVHLIKPLINCILKLSSHNTIIYCCYEIRDVDANNLFLEEISKHFNYKRVPRYKLHPDYTNNLIELIVGKLIRKSKKK